MDLKIDLLSVPRTSRSGKLYQTATTTTTVSGGGSSGGGGGSSVTFATQADAEEATIESMVMSPLRVLQSIVYRMLNNSFADLSTTDQTIIGAINELFATATAAAMPSSRAHLYMLYYEASTGESYRKITASSANLFTAETLMLSEIDYYDKMVKPVINKIVAGTLIQLSSSRGLQYSAMLKATGAAELNNNYFTVGIEPAFDTVFTNMLSPLDASQNLDGIGGWKKDDTCTYPLYLRDALLKAATNFYDNDISGSVRWFPWAVRWEWEFTYWEDLSGSTGECYLSFLFGVSPMIQLRIHAGVDAQISFAGGIFTRLEPYADGDVIKLVYNDGTISMFINTYVDDIYPFPGTEPGSYTSPNSGAVDTQKISVKADIQRTDSIIGMRDVSYKCYPDIRFNNDECLAINIIN